MQGLSICAPWTSSAALAQCKVILCLYHHLVCVSSSVATCPKRPMTRRTAKSTSEEQAAYQKYGQTRQYCPYKVCAPTIGASQKRNTTYRHLRLYGRHLDASLEEIPAEFDPRYRTQPFDRPRFRRTDTVNSVSVYSKTGHRRLYRAKNLALLILIKNGKKLNLKARCLQEVCQNHLVRLWTMTRWTWTTYTCPNPEMTGSFIL